jgi:hypothetical protein
LQPWHNAGVSWLYFPEADEPRSLLGHVRPAPFLRRASQPREKEEPAAPAGAGSSGLKITEDTLPEPWKKILARLAPAPLIWTYVELGWDLLVEGDARRRELLRKLILGLRLRQGSSAFLPLKVPGASPEEAAGEKDVFSWFLERLGGKIVILLGKDTLEQSPYAGLGLTYFRETLIRGRIILSLPGLNELSEDEAKLEATLAYLSSSASIALQRMPHPAGNPPLNGP